jgi:hypothetical protein
MAVKTTSQGWEAAADACTPSQGCRIKEQLNLSNIVSDFIAGRKEASHD